MANAISIVVIVAGLVWVGFMLTAMVGVLRLAPKGARMRAYNQLSMWKFAEIRADLGVAVEPHLRAMRRGAYAFLIFAVVAAVVAVAGAVLSPAMNRGAA